MAALVPAISSPSPESDLVNFKTHLVALLSVYERGPYLGAAIPRYEGPADEVTESILRSLDGLAKRAWRSEGRGERVGGSTSGDDSRMVDGGGVVIKDSTSSDHSQTAPILLASNTADTNDSRAMSAAEELEQLKTQVQDVARVCNAIARGDLSQKITVPVHGAVMVQIKDDINIIVDNLGQFAKEITRVSKEVGVEGKLGAQALVPDVEGTWREVTGEFNNLVENLTSQIRSIAIVTNAVSLGDLSKWIEVEARGEIMELKNVVNGLVVRLRALTAEITRVALDVGARGTSRLELESGGQTQTRTRMYVPDFGGVWAELVGDVDGLCSTITDLNTRALRVD